MFLLGASCANLLVAWTGDALELQMQNHQFVDKLPWGDLHRDEARRAEPVQRARGQLSAAPAAGCRIHDREIPFVHRVTTALRSSCLPICPARMTRLTFIAALRGKS